MRGLAEPWRTPAPDEGPAEEDANDVHELASRGGLLAPVTSTSRPAAEDAGADKQDVGR